MSDRAWALVDVAMSFSGDDIVDIILNFPWLLPTWDVDVIWRGEQPLGIVNHDICWYILNGGEIYTIDAI